MAKDDDWVTKEEKEADQEPETKGPIGKLLGTDQALFVGSKILLRLQYLKVFDDVQVFAPGTREVLVETLTESQFAYYDWDVVVVDKILGVDVFVTAGIIYDNVNPPTPNNGAIQCALMKRRIFGDPDKIEVRFQITNGVSGSGIRLGIKIYRRAGLD